MSNQTCQDLVAAAKQTISEITTDELKQLIANNIDFKLVDVREDSEWEQGSLPNAIHMGRGVLEFKIEKQIPDHNTKIILFCGGGSRSALAAENLQKMGYTDVCSLIGGYRGFN